MHIRRASIRDSAGLAKVQVDSYRTAYHGLLPDIYLDQFTYEEETQDWINLLSEVGQDVVYVAVNDADHVLGYALGRPLTDTEFDCELRAIHVLKDHQRRGIGTALVSAIASYYANAGCASLMLWTLKHNPVRAMYEKWGGEVVGERSETWEDGTQITDVAYGWSDIRRLIRVFFEETAAVTSSAKHSHEQTRAAGPSDL